MDDKLQILLSSLRSNSHIKMESGEGALLLAEIDRLRVRCRQIDDEAYDYAQQIERQKEEMDRLYAAAKQSADRYAEALAENDRLRDDLQKQTETVQYLIGERTADREHWEQIETRLDHAEAIIDRVRALHGEGFTRGCCKTCKGYDSFDVPLPCPTLRALDGDVSSHLYRAEGRSMSNPAKNEWQRVAQRLGEFFLSVQSDLYYNFPPHIWLDWALNQIEGLRGRAERAERKIGAFLSGFERRGLLPEGREPLAEEVIEAVAQVFERVERVEASLNRVRALHYSTPSYDYDEEALFCKECGADFPCPTLRALDRDGAAFRQHPGGE